MTEAENMENVFSRALDNSSLHHETRMFDPSRVNHFQTVPALPGAQPLTIAGGASQRTRRERVGVAK